MPELDESTIRRIMREERENEKRESERDARDAKRDQDLADLRDQVKGLTAKPKGESGDDHEFEA